MVLAMNDVLQLKYLFVKWICHVSRDLLGLTNKLKQCNKIIKSQDKKSIKHNYQLKVKNFFNSLARSRL